MISQYTARVVDTLADTVVDTVPLRGLKYAKRLNSAGTASATLDLAAFRGRGTDAHGATEPVVRSVYLYRDETPVWGGLITGRTYDSSDETIAIDLADWWWILDRRVIRPDPATLPPDNIAEQVVAFLGTDQNDLVRELVRLAQLGTNRNLRLNPTAGLSLVSRERNYFGYELRRYGEVLRQLSQVIDGPDLRFDVAFVNGSPTPQRVLHIGTPLLGREEAAVKWEHGGNMLSYTFPADPSEHADRVYSVGDGIALGTPILVLERADLGEDVGSWPALDIVVNGESGTIEADTLLRNALDRMNASAGYLTVIAAVVRGDAAPLLGSYVPGQDSSLIVDNMFHELDLLTRIVGVEVEVGDEGEKVTPELSPVISSGGISVLVGE